MDEPPKRSTHLIGVTWGLAIVLGLGVIVLLFWGDEALDPEVQRALRQPERLALDANLFYPLAGFAVAGGEDPAEAGYAAVTRVNDLLDAPLDAQAGDIGPKVQAAWIEPALGIADPTKVLCPLIEAGCIASLWARRTDLRALAGEHQTLMARYRRLAGFPAFQVDLRPHVEMPLPRFDAILSTHRLVLGAQVVGYLRGEDEHLGAVLDDLRFSRRLLGQADAVLFKMVAAAMMADALHAYAALMDREGVNIEDFPVLEPLSAAEVSLEASIMGEFRFVASALADLPEHPETYEELGLPPWLGAAGLRPLFKPNRTLNRDFACWQATLALSRLLPRELRAQGDPREAPACRAQWYDWVLNPVGVVLGSVSGPDFRRYVGRLHDLDGLITLVNLKRSLRHDGVTTDGVEGYLSTDGAAFLDPYTQSPMRWDGEARTLHFAGAEPDLGYDRLPLDPLRAGSS